MGLSTKLDKLGVDSFVLNCSNARVREMWVCRAT